MGFFPSYSHLRTYGCLCCATNTTPHKDKFAPRAFKCLFLGYSFGKKAYRVYDLTTHKVFDSRDVQFYEDIFPFSSQTSDSSTFNLFPTYEDIVFSDELTHSDSQLSTPSDLVPASDSQLSSPSDLVPPVHSTSQQSQFDSQQLAPRVGKVPSKFKDYTGLPSLFTENDSHVAQVSSTAYPLTNYISYSGFSPSYQHFLAQISSIVEPKSYKQAV